MISHESALAVFHLDFWHIGSRSLLIVGGGSETLYGEPGNRGRVVLMSDVALCDLFHHRYKAVSCRQRSNAFAIVLTPSLFTISTGPRTCVAGRSTVHILNLCLFLSHELLVPHLFPCLLFPHDRLSAPPHLCHDWMAGSVAGLLRDQ